MPLNGSGTYSAPASSWNPAVDNTDINSTDWAALLADITTALSTAMYKDGQQTVTANVPMASHKLTGLSAGTTAGDSVRYEQATSAVAITGGTISGVPLTVNTQNAGYTLVLADAGKWISMATAGTFTIPANASVAFPIGTVIAFFNGTTSSTIPITSDTMTLAGTATTGTRTLAANGIANALKLTATTWVISGTGLS